MELDYTKYHFRKILSDYGNLNNVFVCYRFQPGYSARSQTLSASCGLKSTIMVPLPQPVALELACHSSNDTPVESNPVIVGIS